MHPSMLNELIKSHHRELVENHKKLVRMRRFEIPDHAWIDKGSAHPVAVDSPSALVAKIAGWLGRMRTARAG